MKLTIVKILCGLSVFSLLLYAFTGLSLWSQLQPGDGELRFLLLLFAHIVPFVAWSFTKAEA